MMSRKYIKRVIGEPKEVPPPIAKKLENQAHRWMVAIEWLNKPKNKDFDIPSRIAASGVAWGDEKDPEEIEAMQKQVKEEKEDIKQKKVVEGGGKSHMSTNSATCLIQTENSLFAYSKSYSSRSSGSVPV